MADGGEVIEIDLWNDVVLGAVREVYQRFRVARPALVSTVDRAASRITAALMGRFVGTDLQAREEPEVPDVPVVHYAGGGYGAWMDMRQGDPAVVVCCDGPVRGFYETGTAVTPSIGQGHDYGCAVAFPGGRVSAVEQPTPPPNAAGEMHVGAADGSASIAFRGAGIPSPAEQGTVVVQADGALASIFLGSPTASFPAALADAVDTNLVQLNNLIQQWTPVPQDGGASLKVIFQLWATTLQNMADAKVRLDGPA